MTLPTGAVPNGFLTPALLGPNLQTAGEGTGADNAWLQETLEYVRDQLFNGLLSGFENVAQVVWDGLQTLIQAITDGAENTLDGIRDWMSNIGANFQELLSALQGNYTGSDPFLSAIQSFVTGKWSLLGSLNSMLIQIGDVFAGAAIVPINAIVQGIQDWIGALTGWKSTTTDGVTTAHSLAETVQASVSNFVDFVWQGASNAVGGGTGKTQSEARAALLSLFGISSDAQVKALDAQAKLQQLLAQEEANNSGGKSGSDDFNRADNSSSLGSDWTQINSGNASTTLGIKSNTAGTTVGGSALARNYAVWNGTDQPTSDYHQASTLFSGGFDTFGSNYVGILVRWDGQVAASGYPNNAVSFMIGQEGLGNYTFKLYRFVAGVRTELASISGASIGGSDIIQLRAGSLADERNFQVFQNGTAILGYTDSADATLIGAAYRKVGFVLVNDYYAFLMRGTAAINSFAWSDIPSPADVVGKFFKFYRSSTSAVAMTANAQIPASTFDTRIVPSAYEELIIDAGRGVFRVPETGLWKFEFIMAGTTASIAANAKLYPQARLYYGGSSLEFNRRMTSIVLSQGNSAGTMTPGPTMFSCTQYLTAGQYVAPGWAAAVIASCTGDGAGDRMSFTGYKVAA